MMTDILDRRYPALSTDALPPLVPRGGISILFDMVSAPTAHDGGTSEVDHFSLEPTQDLSMDVIEWWKLYGGKYPRYDALSLTIYLSVVGALRASQFRRQALLCRQAKPPQVHI
ncbi:hypothetical protein ACHHYP_11295 [Achlya hypogyna]|uniref:HAT C-terminal dimerisation domain-containing protein n=1 Tax=Achlya hypogyna TaxID=1202772 RepID=A0A1V9YJC4_ACHHY|nr:hypothetical protein ACHHYP_11295 [Achlya hypogyna]